jgi:hypothetical protein
MIRRFLALLGCPFWGWMVGCLVTFFQYIKLWCPGFSSVEVKCDVESFEEFRERRRAY